MFSKGTSGTTAKRIDIPYALELCVSNDSSTYALSVSTNENTTDLQELKAGETQTFPNIDFDTVYIKSVVAGQDCAYRVSTYGKREISLDNYPKDVFPGGKY